MRTVLVVSSLILSPRLLLCENMFDFVLLRLAYGEGGAQVRGIYLCSLVLIGNVETFYFSTLVGLCYSGY